MQQQKNRVEAKGNNKHFVLSKTMENANYSPEPRLCSFVAAQLETGLFKSFHWSSHHVGSICAALS